MTDKVPSLFMRSIKSILGAILALAGIVYAIINIGYVWPETFAILVLGLYTMIECLLWIPMFMFYCNKLNNATTHDEQNFYREKTMKWSWPTEYIDTLRLYEGLTILVIAILFVES